MESKVRFKENVSYKKQCIIEFQAFRGDANEFIIKELVILDLMTSVVYYFLFKPPFPFSSLHGKALRTNRWLMNYFHHISWTDGFTGYEELNNIMYYYCQQYDAIHTTGEEKAKWIQMYSTAPVKNCTYDKGFGYDISDICISVHNPQHRVSNCALSRAYRLRAFLFPTLTISKDAEEVSGGGSCYKYECVPHTYHELYSSV